MTRRIVPTPGPRRKVSVSDGLAAEGSGSDEAGGDAAFEADGGIGAAPGGGDDRWNRLWTPHRLQYIKGASKPTGDDGVCPFCHVPTMGEPESLIVHRGETAYVVMNLYPYNSGHILVCPYRHFPDYTEATDVELQEIAHLTQQAMSALREAAGPQGFNLGINQGSIAGAGVAAHLHQHGAALGGDINFMPIVGGTKTMPMPWSSRGI